MKLGLIVFAVTTLVLPTGGLDNGAISSGNSAVFRFGLDE